MGRIPKGRIPAQVSLLRFYDPGAEAILRLKCRSLSVAYNSQLVQSVEALKSSAALREIAYMTGAQLGWGTRIIAMNRYLLAGLWDGPYYGVAKNFDVFINPVLQSVGGARLRQREYCGCFPGMEFIVDRAERVSVEYIGEDKDILIKEFEGFPAYVLQHAMDHLDGRLPIDWPISTGNFSVLARYETTLPKTAFLVKQYVEKLRHNHTFRSTDITAPVGIPAATVTTTTTATTVTAAQSSEELLPKLKETYGLEVFAFEKSARK